MVYYDVTIINGNQNCNIKCSSGFYLQVARPCFSALGKGSVFTHLNVSIAVTDMIVTNDKNTVEANRQIRFKLSKKNDHLAGVVVHIYHSSRLVQIQSSDSLTNGCKAAIWFVRMKRFHEQANAKKFQIKETNNTKV